MKDTALKRLDLQVGGLRLCFYTEWTFPHPCEKMEDDPNERGGLQKIEKIIGDCFRLSRVQVLIPRLI
ncbi:hypothetical protein PanWU01x14_251330, partial [Parasponia andersonii]